MALKSRNTIQKEVISNIANKESGFFNAEDLYDKVSKIDNNIGIATIYRFLKESKENRELYSFTCERKQIYSKNKTTHCHFICEKCEKTFHFDVNNIDFIPKKLGKPTHVLLEVKGICNECK